MCFFILFIVIFGKKLVYLHLLKAVVIFPTKPDKPKLWFKWSYMFFNYVTQENIDSEMNFCVKMLLKGLNTYHKKHILNSTLHKCHCISFSICDLVVIKNPPTHLLVQNHYYFCYIFFLMLFTHSIFNHCTGWPRLACAQYACRLLYPLNKYLFRAKVCCN